MSRWSEWQIEMMEFNSDENEDDNDNLINYDYDDYDEEEMQDYIESNKPICLADGTKIFGLESDYIEYIKPCTLKEIKLWYEAYTIKENYKCWTDSGEYLDLLNDGYVFPESCNKYFGYIIHSIFYYKDGEKYYKLYVVICNGHINTITFKPSDSHSIVTKGIKKYFGEMIRQEDLQYLLIRFEFKNRIGKYGKYSQILKFRIFDEEIEKDLFEIINNKY